MKPIQIFIDSCGELNKDNRTKYGIDYCPMTLNIDGKEYLASLDYDQGISFHDFYEIMRSGKRCFTSQVPTTIFEEKFKKAISEGKDVLYISCSSALSASYASAVKVANEIMEGNKDAKVICFDSKNSCYGQASMAIKAASLRDEGKSIEEIVAWLSENINRFNQFATVDDLKYLKQAGRVKASAAFFGNIFSVHPILISDVNGNNLAVKKINGKKKAISYIAQSLVENAIDIENQTVYICHADDLDSANAVKEAVLKLAKPKSIFVGPMGPIIGASTGPGTLGCYCFGKENCLEYVKKDA